MHPLFQKLLDEIPRPQSEIDEVRAALNDADDEQYTRVIAAKLPMWIDPQNHPEWIALWEQIWITWGKPSPFSHVPLREVLAMDCYVGSHLYPNKVLRDATNQMARDLINIHKNHFFIRAFLKANSTNWEYFIQMFPTWRKLYANFKAQDDDKDLWIEKISPQEVHIYDRLPFAKAVSYVIEGIFGGFMDLFQVSGEISSLLIDPDLLRVQIQWEQ